MDSDHAKCYFRDRTYVEGELPKTRVLSVVDDDASVREAAGRLIKSFGFTVEVFASGEELLLFGSLRNTSCLVIDVHMPGMSGLQLQSHLARAGYRIPIIFITARPDERTREQPLQAGPVAFLTHPSDPHASPIGFRPPFTP